MRPSRLHGVQVQEECGSSLVDGRVFFFRVVDDDDAPDLLDFGGGGSGCASSSSSSKSSSSPIHRRARYLKYERKEAENRREPAMKRK
mmetsp:Transcript_16290/g.33068  ORF Transcript_16290/g.33068 Transcript_16290/m.33068 type:complete len:88 (+) Transcript_16290:111-374(+)